MQREDDGFWMGEALLEAAKGLGLTAPNPPVGAVLVKNGLELGRGWHQRAGQPHAERQALADAIARHGADAVRGATIYVTLEPCCTTGRTPPCTDALIAHRLARVVYGAVDVNPLHAGRADALLREHGIRVEQGIRESECRRLLRGFESCQRRGRPWLIAKSAQSLDARITRPEGEGPWLTGPESLAAVQRMRAKVDGILTSGATLRHDNPALTLRVPHPHGEKPPLWRIIATRSGRLPWKAQALTDEFAGRTIVARFGAYARPPALPAEVSYVSISGWLELLEYLTAEHGMQQVLVEAGGRMLGSLFDARLLDEWHGWFAPMLNGGGVVGLGGLGFGHPEASARLVNVDWQTFGHDVCMSGVIEYPEPEPKPLRPAVFFDRDGVVNDPGCHYYVTRWEDFVFQPGIMEALKFARAAGYALVLVTSQRGVGKGMMTREALESIHAQMQRALAAEGCAFDAIYAYTGKAPDGLGAKPNPYYVLKAAEALGLDLASSWMVGDADRDIEMGIRAGLRTVRVGRHNHYEVAADYMVENVAGLVGLFQREW